MAKKTVTIFHDNMELKGIAKAFYRTGDPIELNYSGAIKSKNLWMFIDSQPHWDNDCINSPAYMQELKDQLLEDFAERGAAFLQELLICLKLELFLARSENGITSDAAYEKNFMTLLKEVMAFISKEFVGKKLNFDVSSEAQWHSFIQHIAFNDDWNNPQFTGRLLVGDWEETFVINEHITEITFSKYGDRHV